MLGMLEASPSKTGAYWRTGRVHLPGRQSRPASGPCRHPSRTGTPSQLFLLLSPVVSLSQWPSWSIMEARGHPKPAQDPGAHELLQPDWFLACSGDLATVLVLPSFRIGDAPVPEPTRKRFRELRATHGSPGEAQPASLLKSAPSLKPQAPCRKGSACTSCRSRCEKKAWCLSPAARPCMAHVKGPGEEKPARATLWFRFRAGGVLASTVARAELCVATSFYNLFTALGEWLTFAIGGIEPLHHVAFCCMV